MNDDTTSIRAATRGDAGALARLAPQTHAAAFGSSMAVSDLALHLARHLSDARVREYLHDDVVLVAEQRDALVGFVQLGAIEGVGELRRLYVRTDLIGRGIGSRLLE